MENTYFPVLLIQVAYKYIPPPQYLEGGFQKLFTLCLREIKYNS